MIFRFQVQSKGTLEINSKSTKAATNPKVADDKDNATMVMETIVSENAVITEETKLPEETNGNVEKNGEIVSEDEKKEDENECELI